MKQKNTLSETYTLMNGINIPKIGLGTWFIPDDEAAAAVCKAVEIGYRHIDTAQAYENERGIGKGVRDCGISRQELFITTKLAAELKTYEEAAQAITGSLEKMGLDYIDLMLIHSPQPWTDFRGGDYAAGNREAWRALEDAYKAGKIRAIGISNFQEHDIENILSSCTIKPMVNQLLAHIGNTPANLIEYCRENGILVEAYSPVAHGEILKSEEVRAIAEKYQVTVPQLCIRYDLQLGTLPLPKTANPAHMRENAKVDFEIYKTAERLWRVQFISCVQRKIKYSRREKMNRPYIFCHMMTSLDGKIMGSYMNTKEGENAGNVFYNISFGENPYYKHQGWLSGRVTTDDNFTFYEKPALDENAPVVPEGDFVANGNAGMYYVSVDPAGKLGWKSGKLTYVDTHAHVIEVLTGKASNSYKAFLRKLGISYIVAGVETLDYEMTMEKLKKLFGIETLMLGGGGVLNWSFIQAGMCDEVSVVIAPVADGSSKTPALFNAKDEWASDTPVAFELQSAEIKDGGSVWLRYLVKR